MKYSVIRAICVIFPLVCNTSSADVIDHTFQLDTQGTIIDDTLTISQTFNGADGVSFTAELAAMGSADLGRGSTGIGVNGNSNTLINGTEYVSFTISLSDITGGSVVFDGFNGIDFNALDTGEQVAISNNAAFDNPGDIIFTGDADPDDEFTLDLLDSFFAVSNGSIANTFRIDDVSAQFTTTASAVPEPSQTLGVCCLAALAYFCRRRKFCDIAA